MDKRIERSLDENIEYDLFGVYTTDDIDTRDRKIKVTKFAEAIKEFLTFVPEDKKLKLVIKFLTKC